MSTFFKALQQAERDRALAEPARRDTPLDSELRLSAPTARQEIPLVDTAKEAGGAPPEGVEEHLVSLLRPASLEAEHYRALRHLVEQADRSANLTIVAVSAPAEGDGKTLTAINLAGALAQAPDIRVLLVDTDLRRPAVAQRLGLAVADGPGLVDAILSPTLALENVARPCPPFNLSVVPAGRASGIPYELLKSPRLGELLDAARRQYDHVVVDTPPLVPIPDCQIIAKSVDGFLVVVSAHKTPRKLVEESLRSVKPDKLVGIVFNKDDRSMARYYYAADRRSRNGNGARRWIERMRSTGSWARARR